MVKTLYLILVGIIILSISTGIIILWDDEISQVLNFQENSKPNNPDNVNGEKNEESENPLSEGMGSGEISEEGSTNGETSIDSNCISKQIPYSLKNFEESILCQEQEGEECINLIVNCSVEIYNLDDAFSGEFEIKYTLLDSSQNELEEKTLRDSVEFGEQKLFMIDFTRNDIGGVNEDLSCFFSMVDVPEKEVC